MSAIRILKTNNLKPMKSYMFIILVLSLFACNSDDDINTNDKQIFDCIIPSETEFLVYDCDVGNNSCAFKYFDNSVVDTLMSNGISSGKNIVFRLSKTIPGNFQEGDETYETLVFEIDDGQLEFSINNEVGFRGIDLFFLQFGITGSGQFVAITQGCLIGEIQEDQTWRIQGEVIVPSGTSEVEFRFDSIFEKS